MNKWLHIRQIIFDADDTLWENNVYFVRATNQFTELVCGAGFDKEQILRDFDQLELEVVEKFGYGSQNFILILEQLFARYKAQCNGCLDESRFRQIVDRFADHPSAAPDMFPGVMETLAQLKQKYQLFVLTKGEFSEQAGKIKRAGIDVLVQKFFIPPEKNDATYQQLLKEHHWNPEETCMVGNSPKSDINPALRCGMHAIHIPYRDTWKLDDEPIEAVNGRFMQLPDFPALQKVFCK